jgi:hypothetical protein
MVSVALKRLNAGRRRHARTEAEIIREPGTAAQFRQHWIDLAGVPLILLSADEAMAAWNANTYWAFSESSEMTGSVTIHIGTRMDTSGGATPYRFTPVSGGWRISELPPMGIAHDIGPAPVGRPITN